MRVRWVLLALTVAIVPETTAAADRVDLFNRHGNRTGYVTIDRESGRVDLYDVNSRRTGYGQIDRVLSVGVRELT